MDYWANRPGRLGGLEFFTPGAHRAAAQKVLSESHFEDQSSHGPLQRADAKEIGSAGRKEPGFDLRETKFIAAFAPGKGAALHLAPSTRAREGGFHDYRLGNGLQFVTEGVVITAFEAAFLALTLARFHQVL